MRWPIRWSVLLAICVIAPGSLVFAQNETPAKDGAKSASQAATEEEVEQLRREVADLKAMIQKLTQTSSPAGTGGARLVQASAGASDSDQPESTGTPAATAADIDALQKEIELLQKKADQGPPVTAGWTGEHFFLKSSDGNFTLMPVGYINTTYSFYHGSGSPSDTFNVRVARFGVQGNYSKYLDYAFVFDSAASNGISIRDAYIDFKPWTSLQFQGGQFKVPFSQEVSTGYTSLEFNTRSITSVLYPDAISSFRTPGLVAHGALDGGVIQYWAGIFNGKGILAANTTNEPEFVGRVRIYPWRKNKDSLFNRVAFGGSAEHSRSRGISNEITPPVFVDSAYTMFPQLRINGPIERYNAHFQFLHGPWGVRGEYTQANFHRLGVGSEVLGLTGFQSLPGVVGKGAYGQATYFLTGEEEPENAAPRVKRPVIGPESPGMNFGHGWGAWQLKVRYAWLEDRAKGATFDTFQPTAFPTYSAHMSQITAGFNWYLNYWVVLKTDFNVDQIHDPTVEGLLRRNYLVVVQGLQFRF